MHCHCLLLQVFFGVFIFQYVWLLQVTRSPMIKTTTIGLFPLVPNLPVGLSRLEIDHMQYLQWFFTTPVNDYWQILGLRHDQWENAFLQMTVRQGKIEFSPPSICVYGGRKWVSLLKIGSDRWGTWKKTATPGLQPGWIRKVSAN